MPVVHGLEVCRRLRANPDLREGNRAMIDGAYELSEEWIEATHGQAVKIATVDGDAIQIELLEGTPDAEPGSP
jgi:CheY-like chemotaxis protein